MKTKIGISIGDINGVGPEIILKTFADKRLFSQCIPIVYGSSKVLNHYKNKLGGIDFNYVKLESADKAAPNKINIVNCIEDSVEINTGMVTEQGGKAAITALEKMVDDSLAGLLDAIVTAPIHKNAMKKAGFQYPGHTEFFTERFGQKQSLMTMVSNGLRVALVTNHIPVSAISEAVNAEQIKTKLKLLNQTLEKDFGITKPTIAVLGLNPHAGDGGAIGTEDETIIQPTIISAKKNGILAFGPYPADGFFGSSHFSKFDGILAMYHDQGLVPFKALSFGNGVNFTAGLPVVRTSPDHGTAYDIAGKGIASASSFRNALFTAIDISKSRKLLKGE